jgi:hypothetical protein
MRWATSGAGGAGMGEIEQRAVERGRHDLRAPKRLRGDETCQIASVAAADTDDRVSEPRHPPLQRQHHAPDRDGQPTAQAFEHSAGDVVIADHHPPVPGRQQQLRPSGVVAVEVENVIVGERPALSPEPEPQGEIEAQEAGPLRDVGNLGRSPPGLQPGRDQSER